MESRTEGARTLERPDRAPARWTYEQSLKDPSLEEPVDLHIHRRLAWPLIKVIERLDLPVTPAQLTIGSMILGVGAGAAYLQAAGDARWYLAGTALLLLSIMLDCADGMLARLRGLGSHFGMLLDGICDLVVGLAVWYGVSAASTASFDAWWTWPTAFAVLLSIVFHCAFYDGMKNSFVRLSTPSAQRGRLPIDAPIGAGLGGLFQRIYVVAYGGVATITGGGLDRRLDSIDHRTYRAAVAPVMKMTGWLGLGTHLAIMWIACLGGLLRADVPYWVAMIVIVLGLNVWMVATIARRVSISRKLLAGLEGA